MNKRVPMANQKTKPAQGRISRAVVILLAALLAACSAPTPPPRSADLSPIALGAGERLRVVATTSLIGDVAAQVGGQHIDLKTLMQAGQDPHSYEPPAADTSAIETAHVVFANGLDLEESLLPILEGAQGRVPILAVSEGVDFIPLPDAPEHGGFDPHVWQDPTNVKIWAGNIAGALAALDPAHAADYAANAEAYSAQLDKLDEEIKRTLAAIPPERRKLVTNHDALAYFARRYRFEIVGTVYLGADSAAEPSAGQIAQLVDTIKAEGVPAIFVENTFGEGLAQTVAAEAGRPIRVLTLYTDALDLPVTPGDTYIGMMRANARTIASGLAP